MTTLKNSLAAWDSDSFDSILKDELESLDINALPLQQGLSQGSHVADTEGFKVMIINSSDEQSSIQVKTGIFYSSLIAGCSCADDPAPVETCSEYCELILIINKSDGRVSINIPTNDGFPK